jgi:hypothetical protein
MSAASSAERAARCRRRRRAGTVLVSVVLDSATIDRLVVLGWLADAQRGDRDAVGAALQHFSTFTLGAGEIPVPSRPLAASWQQPTFTEQLRAALARRNAPAAREARADE